MKAAAKRAIARMRRCRSCDLNRDIKAAREDETLHPEERRQLLQDLSTDRGRLQECTHQETKPCGCRAAKMHRDCAYCGWGWADGKICGSCRDRGIDGKVIAGTAARSCAAHKKGGR